MASASARSAPLRRLARALALVALLVGPLAATELWVRGQLDLLYPYLLGGVFWPDAKLLLLERAGCPQVLALGSSVTNRTLVSELVEGETLPSTASGTSAAPVESVFAFGLNNARTTHLYAAWRHVRARGCTPEVVFVEVLPATLSGFRPNVALLRPFLDASTSFALPRGFAREAGIGWPGLLDAATWGRLLLHRLRGPISTALVEAAGLQAFSGLDRTPPLDGMIRPLSEGALDATAFARERAHRFGLAARGHYAIRPSDVQRGALDRLVADATGAGARVLLHSPPVTSIYREIVSQNGGHQPFCRTYDALAGARGVEWFFAYDGGRYDPTEFMDWNHLNRAGGKRYVRRLFRAVRSRAYGDGGWCRAHGADATASESAPPAGYPSAAAGDR